MLSEFIDSDPLYSYLYPLSYIVNIFEGFISSSGSLSIICTSGTSFIKYQSVSPLFIIDKSDDISNLYISSLIHIFPSESSSISCSELEKFNVNSAVISV